MFLPEKVTASLSSRYSDSSVSLIDSGLKRIFIIYLKEQTYDLAKLVEKIPQIVDKIESEEYTSSRKRLINCLIQVLAREGEDRWASELMNKFYEISKIHQENYIYKEPDSKRYAPLEMLDQRRQYSLPKQKDLLISLYAYLPALRGQDYGNTRLVKLPEGTDLLSKYQELGYNFLDLTTKTIVLGQYKTVKSYGLRVIRLPEIMRKILNNSLGDRRDGYLFLNKRGVNFSDRGFCGYVSDTFDNQCGVKMGIDELRKVYISEVLGYLNRKEFGISEQKYYRTKISQIQAHCLNTQEFLYSGHKFNSSLPVSSDEYMKMILGIIDEIEVSFHKV